MSARGHAGASALTSWNFVLVVATTFFAAGGGVVETFVNYPSWSAVGAAEWHAFRAASAGVVPYFVVPFFSSLVFKAVLVARRPAGVPRWAAWTVLLLQLEVMVVTAAFIVPRFQVPLERAPDRALLEGLRFWDLVLRGVPGLVEVPLVLWLAYRVVRGAPQTSP